MFEEALALGASTVIIDNANIKLKDFSYYLEGAAQRGYKTIVIGIECHTEDDAAFFFGRCVHDVPLKKIQEMRQEYSTEDSDLMVPAWRGEAVPREAPSAIAEGLAIEIPDEQGLNPAMTKKERDQAAWVRSEAPF